MTDRTIMDNRLEDYTMIFCMVVGAVLCCMVGITVMQLTFGSFTDDPDFELYRLHTGAYTNEIDYYLQQMQHELLK